MAEYTISVMGASTVGKTELIAYYRSKLNYKNCGFTKNQCKVSCYLDKKFVDLDILDSWDQYELKKKKDLIQKEQGFILVYDITVRKTFEEIIRDSADIRTKKNAPILLVGNKADKAELSTDRRLLRGQVSTEEAKEIGKILGCKVLETSAIDGRNVGQAFETMVQLINDSKKSKNIGSGIRFKSARLGSVKALASGSNPTNRFSVRHFFSSVKAQLGSARLGSSVKKLGSARLGSGSSVKKLGSARLVSVGSSVKKLGSRLGSTR